VAGRAEYDREVLGRLVPWIDVSIATFNTVGLAGTQTLLAINNPAGSRIVTLRRLAGAFQTAALGQRPIFLLKAPALATMGTVLAQTEDRTAQPAATVVGLGATAADLGGATAITNPGGMVRVWRSSNVGPAAAFQYFDFDGIDQSIEPGESFIVTVDVNGTDNSQMTAYLTEHFGLG